MSPYTHIMGITVYDGKVYVVDVGNHRTQVFDLNGTFQHTIDLGRTWSNHPNDVIVHGEHVYVTDGVTNKIKAFRLSDSAFTGCRHWGTGDTLLLIYFISSQEELEGPSGRRSSFSIKNSIILNSHHRL